MHADPQTQKLKSELAEARRRIAELAEALEAQSGPHRQADGAPLTQHQLFEGLFESDHILVAILDPGFRFVRVNRAYALGAGREPASFVGRQHFELFPDSAAEAVFREVVRTGEPHAEHARPFRRAADGGGEVRYLDWTLAPHKGPDGRVVRLTLLLVDVTDRIAAAEALASSEARYRGLAAAVPVGVFRTDAAGRCVYVNDRLCGMTALPTEAFLGEGWQVAVRPEDRHRVTAGWAEAVAAGRPFSAELRLTGPGGDAVWVYTQALPEPAADGGAAGWVGSVTDITGHRAAREALNGLAASSGGDLDGFLADCTRRLAEAYGARYALVGLRAAADPGRVEARAVWAGDGHVSGVAYDLATAPCGRLLEGGQVFIAQGVREAYADNALLDGLGVESYLGHPLTDAAGEVVGVAVVMDVRPMTLSPWTEPILGSFSRRIAAEVERHRTHRRLERSERGLARAQHIARMGHWEWDVAAGTLTGSEEVARIFGREPGTFGVTYAELLRAVHPDDRERVRAQVEAAVDPARRQPFAVDHRVVLPGGEVRVVHQQGEVTFDPDGTTAERMIGTVHDITLQHRAQEGLAVLASSSAADLEAFVAESARELAGVYGTRLAFVGVVAEDDPGRVRTLAFWTGDRFASNVTYALEGTPCADIVAGRLTLIPERIQERYPEDHFLAEMGIESYFGHPVVGTDGRTLGLVSVLDVRPLHPPSWTAPILGSFARRIAAELERARAEAVRERSERELAAILDNLQDTYYRTDPDGRLERVSPSIEALIGLRADRMLGRPVASFYVEPDGRAKFLAALDASGGHLRDYQTRLRHHDGHVVWASINARHLTDGEGRVVGVEGTVRDITQTRRMAEALRESEARLAEAQSIAHLGSWEWDPETDRVTWSDETYRIHGLAPGSAPLSLAGALQSVHPEDRPRVETALQDALSRGLPFEDDHRIVRPDGTTREVRQIVVVHPARGGTARVAGAVQDITRLARAEADRERFHAQLLQSQKMEAVGLLAGGVAHDFNNLLTTITGYTDLGLQHAGGPDGPLREALTEVRLAAERAAALTRQLLLFSRRQPLAFAPVDLAERVEPLLKMLRRVIGEDVEVRTDIAPGLWPVRADGMSVDQLLMNLAINARDAMPEGGRLSIAVANAEVSEAAAEAHPEAAPGRYVRITVADTGVGMDPETLARVFEPFFTTKDPGHGTGLGMSVAHGIARQHGGWIQAESGPGEGTRFHVFLPVAQAPRSVPAPAPAAASPAAPGGRVLVVEDEQALRAFARTALTQQGYRVEVAATAREALEVFEGAGGAFDLVFSDVVLPDRSGLKLVEELRARHPDLKVLLSSGYPDPHAAWSDIQERGLPFIQKPYSLESLLKAVGEGLGMAPAP